MTVPHSKVLRNVLREEAFYFFTSIGNYTGVSASSLEEFEQRLKDVDLKSLEFHLFREDFEKWIAQTLGDDKLAAEIKFLRAQKITGNALRDRLDFVVSRRLKELKSGVGSPLLPSGSSSAWTSRERSPPSADL